MKTVWLTQEQLKEAQRQVERIRDDVDDIEIVIPPIDTTLFFDASDSGIYLNTLLFRRTRDAENSSTLVEKGNTIPTSNRWVLISPIQVVDEWLAREMQLENDSNSASGDYYELP